MIFEARTYTFKPGGAVREWIGRFGEAYPTRAKYSPLYGFFQTEIGPLNQVVHIWAYDSLQQRADIRAQAAKDPSGKWPPVGVDLLVNQENDILTPIKGMTAYREPQKFGELYELRMYTYAAGEVAKVAEKFAEGYAARAKLYPVAGIWTSELGNLNRLYQLFPYKDWAHRDQVRAEYLKSGVWPVHTDSRPVSQLVRHMVPSAFSPLH